MGINSVPPVWFLLRVGFRERHGNQLGSLKMVSAHITHLFSVTVTECSALVRWVDYEATMSVLAAGTLGQVTAIYRLQTTH